MGEFLKGLSTFQRIACTLGGHQQHIGLSQAARGLAAVWRGRPQGISAENSGQLGGVQVQGWAKDRELRGKLAGKLACAGTLVRATKRKHGDGDRWAPFRLASAILRPHTASQLAAHEAQHLLRVGCNKAIEGGPIEHCKLRIAHGDRSGGARFAGEHSHLAQQVSLAQFGKQAARGRDAAAVPGRVLGRLLGRFRGRLRGRFRIWVVDLNAHASAQNQVKRVSRFALMKQDLACRQIDGLEARGKIASRLLSQVQQDTAVGKRTFNLVAIEPLRHPIQRNRHLFGELRTKRVEVLLAQHSDNRRLRGRKGGSARMAGEQAQFTRDLSGMDGGQRERRLSVQRLARCPQAAGDNQEECVSRFPFPRQNLPCLQSAHSDTTEQHVHRILREPGKTRDAAQQRCQWCVIWPFSAVSHRVILPGTGS